MPSDAARFGNNFRIRMFPCKSTSNPNRSKIPLKAMLLGGSTLICRGVKAALESVAWEHELGDGIGESSLAFDRQQKTFVTLASR